VESSREKANRPDRIWKGHGKKFCIPELVMMKRLLVLFGCLLVSSAFGENREESLRAAIKKLKLPGVHINLDERCVDVDAEVCLHSGSLELLVCSKNTKEHESIVMTPAKGMHIHTALLLLGAKAGHPAIRKVVDEESGGRWIDIPPRGAKVTVFLVIKGENGEMNERPINDFIHSLVDVEENQPRKFPTNTFVFAGSHLVDAEEGPKKYMADGSGNIISLSTFGDELLCLPSVNTHDNGGLIWEVNSEGLPKVGTKVTLRLRPELNKGAPKGK